jgi:transcriptional regulator with XRE-family HTH domain
MASFGENLRRERELRGIALRDVAQATKISVRFLQALEEGRVEVLPGGIFRRSFVREYARFIGLDADRLVSEFLHAHGEAPRAAEPSAPTPSAPAPSAAATAPARSRTALYRRLFFGVGLLAACGSAVHLTRTPAPAPVAVAVEPAPPIVFPQDQLLPQISSAAVADDATPGALVLTLSANESCWVGVEVDGHVVLNKVLSSGESQTLSATDQIVLSVGNAGALALTINDRPGLALGRRGEVRRNIVITKQNLPSLVEDSTPGRSSHSG